MSSTIKHRIMNMHINANKISMDQKSFCEFIQ